MQEPTEPDISPETRADRAAAMPWWEVARIPFKHQRMAIVPPDHYTRTQKWIVRQEQNRHPETGRYNYKGAFVFTLFSTAFFGTAWAIGIATQSLLWFSLALATLVPVGLFYGLVSKVLIFRAGGWEQVLEGRDIKTARRQELRKRQL